MRMSYAAWVLVLLSLAASSHGFASYDDALKYLERLEHEVEEQTHGLRMLIADGKNLLGEEHGLEFRRAKARSEETTEDILRAAARRNCPAHIQNEIAKVGSDVDDRWESCMNMTRKLIDFENATFILWKDYLSWRPTICNAANNISYCFLDSSLISKVTCAYDGMTGYLGEFKTIKDKMVEAVESIHSLVLKTISDFKACFGSAQNADKELQLRILEEGCPLKRGKLITKMT
uniref:Uncharacterized protein n=1 Tax=Riptortus pedestris TaxID=329032 RepID=R4WCN7_RIPPE|nr:unknown secreted protein [Riptortus pedestris]